MVTRLTTVLVPAVALTLACAAVSTAALQNRHLNRRAAIRPVPSPVIVLAANGFDWTDAGIGAAAGFGLATIAAAALTLTRGRLLTGPSGKGRR